MRTALARGRARQHPQRGRDDLARACAVPVDEDDDRQPGREAADRAEGLARLVAADHGDHDTAVEEERRDPYESRRASTSGAWIVARRRRTSRGRAPRNNPSRTVLPRGPRILESAALMPSPFAGVR